MDEKDPCTTSHEYTVIQAALNREYPGHIYEEDGKIEILGNFSGVPWNSIEHVALGIADLAARVLDLTAGKIGRHSVLSGGEADLRAGYWIAIPRRLSPEELESLHTASKVFAFRASGADRDLTRKMFRSEDPELVSHGIEAADAMRRAAPGTNLGGHVSWRVAPELDACKIGPKIGSHPDPETDLAERKYRGRVGAVNDDASRIEIRTADPETESPDSADASRKRKRLRKGKTIRVEFDRSQFSIKDLTDFMAHRVEIHAVTLPKIRGGRERLTLRAIAPVDAAAG